MADLPPPFLSSRCLQIAAAARCLLCLPLDAVAAPDDSGTDADAYSGTPTS